MAATTKNANHRHVTPLTAESLAHFHGSENFHRHQMSGMTYTDGIDYLAEAGGAYWLIDAIGSYQRDRRLTGDGMLRDYQIWQLRVNADKSATLTCQADTNEPYAIEQKIEFTDFPLPAIKLTVERGGMYNAAGQVVPCMTLMLPSER